VAGAPLRNLARCVRRCDLELAGVVTAPYAAALSSLVEDEQELGAACLDMGAGSTGVSIFLRRQLIFADAARVGGAHVTRDVSEAFSIEGPLAERIKVIHGGVVATGLDDRELISAPPIGAPEGHERHVTRSALIGVIRPRVEEILEEARALLDAAGFDHLPSRRIVLTGAAASFRASRTWRGGCWASGCGSAGRSASAGCRSRRRGRASPRPWASRPMRCARTTRSGTSRRRRRSADARGSGARCAGSGTTGDAGFPRDRRSRFG